MGAWGHGILSDDFARDVYDAFLDKYNDGLEGPRIRKALELQFAEAILDRDEGPVFWLALARAEWECGALEPDILKRVEAAVTGELGLDRWREAGEKALAGRRKALRGFLETLRRPKEKPRKRKKPKLIPAPYDPGACLAFRLEDGDYGAALVLAADTSHKTEGMNLVATLKYKQPEMPGLEVFEAREWLVLTHHAWKGKPDISWCLARFHKRDGKNLEVVGVIPLIPSDPKTAGTYSGWDMGDELVMQDRWDRGIRD